MGLYNGSETGQNRVGHRMKRGETGRKPVGNGSETGGKRIRNGLDTGQKRVSFRVSLGFFWCFSRFTWGLR